MKTKRSIMTITPMLLCALAVLAAPSAIPAATKSDFNGDGWGDLAVGVPYESFNGKVKAGVIHIIYGKSDGLSASGSRLFSQDTNDGSNCPGVAGDEDFFGNALATGDFNKDGYSDLATGAPYIGSTAGGEGVVHIFYGSASGLSCSRSQLLSQGLVGGIGHWQDLFGYALISGDFNDDSYADLAIGTPGDGSGSVTVLYGGRAGLKVAGAQRWTLDTPGIFHPAEPTDYFGNNLAAGDFGKGSATDLVISMNWRKPNFDWNSGAVAVVYGSRSGLTAVGSQFWTRDTPGLPGTAGAGDGFGTALAAGDFGKSAQDDLAISVPDEGLVHILYGSSKGLTIKENQLWTGFVPVNFQNGMIAADFGQSAHADLVVGGTLLFGTPKGLSLINGQVINVPFSFSPTLAAANYGKDPHFDLAFGHIFEDVGGVQSAGAVRIFYGSPTGLDLGSIPKLWTQDTPGILDPAESWDRFGYSLSR